MKREREEQSSTDTDDLSTLTGSSGARQNATDDRTGWTAALRRMTAAGSSADHLLPGDNLSAGH